MAARDHRGVTPGGSEVFRYENEPVPRPYREDVFRYRSDIERHIEAHMGVIAGRLIGSPALDSPIDLMIVAPSNEYPFWTFVTGGMSDLPMAAPDEVAEEYGHCELVFAVPEKDFAIERPFVLEVSYDGYDPPLKSPVRELAYWAKTLARFVHQQETWLFFGHSVPTDDPPTPIWPDSPMNGFVLSLPLEFPEAAHVCRTADGIPINFWALIPIYPEEMMFKLNRGFDKLGDRLVARGVSEVFHSHRPNVCARKPFLGLF